MGNHGKKITLRSGDTTAYREGGVLPLLKWGVGASSGHHKEGRKP
jgi:hypothetical protein